jgi:hypothetical protein
MYKDFYPSRFLKVDDLKGRKVALTISRCTPEEIGQGADKKTKLVAYFREIPKGLVVNRTNAEAMAELIGNDDEQAWPGHRIVLVPSRTQYQGKRVACIRVEEAGTAALTLAPVDASDLFAQEFTEEGEPS